MSWQQKALVLKKEKVGVILLESYSAALFCLIMASQLKHKIAKTIYNLWHKQINVGSYNEFFECFSLRKYKPNKIIWQIHLPLKEDVPFDDVLLKNSRDQLLEDKAVKNVTQNESIETVLNVELDEKCFLKDVLESQPTALNYQKPPKKVIVEFSSPNIAKHFHVGHLRSTIIGNCIANIKKKLGDDVIKMNFLGDWGTQFGLLQIGLKLGNYAEEDFKEDPLKVLLKAYVEGNAEAEKDLKVYDEAKKIFSNLESGKEETIQVWNKYREWTIKGLDNIYNRLGVSFDEFEWESDYNRKKADSILEMLEEKGILVMDNLGRKVAVAGHRNLPLIKSDNSTLYLMRDLMALISRRSKYNFDEIYYVVDNGQSEHFTALTALCSELKIDQNVKMEHVKFGKIQGMSTRKGKFTPLSDVLDEAQERVFEKQKSSENTKISLDSKEVADILGVSGVMVNDLQRRRIKDYRFSWDETVKASDNSGILLQYTHCRLSNIQKDTEGTTEECDPEALSEPEALSLAHALARYEERLLDSNRKLEPCTLTMYLFDLVKAINMAYLRLRVKKSDAHVAQQRDLLFRRSREVLNEGMRLLGLRPLTKM